MRQSCFVSGAFAAALICGTSNTLAQSQTVDSSPVQVTLVEKQPLDPVSLRVIEASTLAAPEASRPRTDIFVPTRPADIASGKAHGSVNEVQDRKCLDSELDISAVKALILTEAARQEVDSKLAIAIADQESGFGTNVNSSAGARGIMQLMPATAVQYGVTDICDPAQNIRGGIAFLKDLNASFGGNIMLIVAAYNSGESRVIKAGGIPSISETVNYTARVTNAYYGFDNTLKGGKRAKSNTAAQGAATSSSGVTELPVQDVSDGSPIPINQPKAKTEGGRQQWIGGSVLYVQ